MIMIVHNNLSRKSLTYDKEVKLLSFIYAEIVCVWTNLQLFEFTYKN